jgi:acetyl esterase/lipase
MTDLDKQTVDPALWPLVESFPPVDLGGDTLVGFRSAMKEMSAMPEASTHPDVRIEVETAGTVRCLRYTPTNGRPDAALLHVHGGGYVMGSPEMDAARNIELARRTGCTILSVDYRLAPEHPHPAALEDCHEALGWLASRVKRLGLIGESAGGGLAAALALLARNRGTAALACQVLIYPMLIPPAQSIDTSIADPRAGRYIWTRASNGWCWSAYLSGSTPAPGTIAGLAHDLTRLPPAFVAVGDVDLFVHDDLAYVGRLLAAGCPVEAHLYPGAIHGFDRMVDAAVTQRYNRDLVGFIGRHLG